MHQARPPFDVSLIPAGDVGAPVVGAVVRAETVFASGLVSAQPCEVHGCEAVLAEGFFGVCDVFYADSPRISCFGVSGLEYRGCRFVLFNSEYDDARFQFSCLQGHQVAYYSGAVEGVDAAVEWSELDSDCF